jgi:UPF0755 protein
MIVGVVFLAAAGLAFFCIGQLKSTEVSLSAGGKGYIRVNQGSTVDEVAGNLQAKGIIDSGFRFKLLARWNNLSSKLKAGGYVISQGMTYQEIIDILASGQTAAFLITVPEGYNVEQIAALLEEKGIGKKEAILELAKNFSAYDYMTDNEDTRYRAEGFLFPDTYEIANDETAENVFKMMAKEFDNKFTEEMRERAAEMELSIRDVVTLASLVEKEARYEEDRPIIAQVFFKRLEIGMPLQSDTTIQYLLDAPKEEVLIADTKLDSPYNTYQNMGLPPGPIANPGLASLKAVLYPADTDYLYFVADKNGRNHYTKSYAEHLETVDRVR